MNAAEVNLIEREALICQQIVIKLIFFIEQFSEFSFSVRSTLNMLKVLVILSLAAATFAQTPVKSCGKGLFVPKAVYFGGKETFCSKPPCILKRGKTAVTEVEFTSPFNSKTITPKAQAKVFGLPITLDLGAQAASACNLLTGGCPLIRNKPTSFRLIKPVEQKAMVGTADVEYSLVGDDNQVIFCYKLKTTVV